MQLGLSRKIHDILLKELKIEKAYHATKHQKF